MSNRIFVTTFILCSLLAAIWLPGCATTSARTAGVTGTDDVTIKRLTRENEELKTKVDDLLTRVLKLSRLVDDHQVKLDYLADKVRTIDSSNQIQTPAVGISKATISGTEQASRQTRQTETSSSIEMPARKNSNPDQLYDEAHADYRSGRFQEAIIKFKEFLMLFPKNNRASNAQYWIGESYYSLQEYENSVQSFQLVLQNYPISSKIPDAMVKKGLCYLMLGKKQKAEVEFQQVIDQFPSSNAAEIARQKLGHE